LILTGLGYTLLVPFRPRFFSAVFNADNLASLESPGLLAIRMVLLVAVATCLLVLTGYWLWKRERIPGVLWLTWVAAASFYLMPQLSSLLQRAPISKEALLIPGVLFVLLTLRASDRTWFVDACRVVCLFTIYASLAVALIWPDYAIDPVPDQTFSTASRLYGIAYHANTLSIFPVLFFGLDAWRHKDWTFVRALNWIAAVGVLLWTQSKASWVGLMAAILIVAWFHRTSTNRRFGIVFLLVLPATFLASGWIMIAGLPTIDLWQALPTFASRTQIWGYAVESWRASPALGYGSQFLRGESLLDFYAAYGWLPGQAHNQFFHTLGQAGLVGVSLWLLYLGGLVACLARIPMHSIALPLYLLSFMLLKSIAEIPFVDIPLHGSFFFHVVTFGIIALWTRAVSHTGNEDDRSVGYSASYTWEVV
jgi:O-antigen ligase